jgi:uncharacterized membrane protein
VAVTTYLLDWAGLLVRWLHVVAGIAWIGASFYFVWLDNHLLPSAHPDAADPRIAGEVWAVHGGGFYRSQKYRLAPAVLPAPLHWFYWEAYTTWLSGFTLLTLLYLFRAEAYLIDPAVLPLSKAAAVGLAVGALVTAWLVYDGLCRSPLGRRPAALMTAIAVMIAGLAWALCHLFSGRGAFMVYGSALGTLMVANVLFVIIPGQRELVRAKQAGREPDAAPGLRGKQRSVHNTYFTLPVVFIMISNHYAMTYGGRYNWLVLIAMSVAGACIRGWFVARHKPSQARGLAAAAPAAIGGLTVIAVIIALSPWAGSAARNAAAQAASTAQPGTIAGGPGSGSAEGLRVQQIIERRCVPCHAAVPREPGFAAPPNGLAFETMDEVSAHLPEMQAQLAARAMPLGNLTQMTDAERSTVLDWISRGARP